MSEAAVIPVHKSPVFCPGCDYDLRGVTAASCPECGQAIDREALQRSRIPWLNRGEMGRIVAFWKTVWRVTFQTRELAYEMARPADLKEARRFRAAVVRRAVIWPVTLALLWTGWGAASGWFEVTGTQWARGAAAAVLLGLWAYTVTGVQTYWFHPKREPVERQNRTVALSYYGAAPLAAVGPLGIVGSLGVALALAGEAWRIDELFWAGQAAIWGAGFGVLVLPIVVLSVAMAMSKAWFTPQTRSPWWLATGLGVALVGLTAWWWFLVPWLGFYLWLMLRTW